MNQTKLIYRRDVIESKLISYGINNRKISYLPYLEFSEEEFQEPYEVGCRILVLWAMSYTATNLTEKSEIEGWLKSSSLWSRVSENEKELFTQDVSKKTLIDFSWHIEACIVLCWAVNLLENLPDLDSKLSEADLNTLLAKLPIDQNPEFFLNSLIYRNKEEIFIENIINEMMTSYLRDMWLSDKKESLKINSGISFERHYALNWLRKFDGISEWDETDTST